MLSQMHVRLHVKYIYFFQILFELEFSRQNFEKYSNIEFREKKPRQVGTLLFRLYGRTDGQTDRPT